MKNYDVNAVDKHPSTFIRYISDKHFYKICFLYYTNITVLAEGNLEVGLVVSYVPKPYLKRKDCQYIFALVGKGVKYI